LEEYMSVTKLSKNAQEEYKMKDKNFSQLKQTLKSLKATFRTEGSNYSRHERNKIYSFFVLEFVADNYGSDILVDEYYTKQEIEKQFSLMNYLLRFYEEINNLEHYLSSKLNSEMLQVSTRDHVENIQNLIVHYEDEMVNISNYWKIILSEITQMLNSNDSMRLFSEILRLDKFPGEIKKSLEFSMELLEGMKQDSESV
jgi:hypothetical protein